MPTLIPLQTGPTGIFRLFGLLFAFVGALYALKPREMTAYAVRRRTRGQVQGRIEPTDTRVLLARVFGGFIVLVGFALATGRFGP